MRLGLAVARRSWLEEKDVVNALPLKGVYEAAKTLIACLCRALSMF